MQIKLDKHGVDYNKLHDALFKKAYRLSDVRDQLESVAFNIVRFKSDDNASRLWEVSSADDGDYIVSLYEEGEDKKAEGNAWEVSLSKTAEALDIFYKGDPIIRIAASKLGIPSEELKSIPRYLPAKLAENKKLVQALLSELPLTAKQLVLAKYPELF